MVCEKTNLTEIVNTMKRSLNGLILVRGYFYQVLLF